LGCWVDRRRNKRKDKIDKNSVRERPRAYTLGENPTTPPTSWDWEEEERVHTSHMERGDWPEVTHCLGEGRNRARKITAGSSPRGRGIGKKTDPESVLDVGRA